MKKLTLKRETLRQLTPGETAGVHGGMMRAWSDLGGCSLGHPCTSGCTEGSKNCLPTPTQPRTWTT